MMTKGFERNLTRLQQKARWAKLGSRVLVGETLVVAVGLARRTQLTLGFAGGGVSGGGRRGSSLV